MARNRSAWAAAARPLSLRDLAPVSARVVVFNVSYLAGCWAVIVLSLACAMYFPAWPVWIASFVLISSRQQALLNTSHECIHGLFVDRRDLNAWVGALFCAYPCGSPFFSTRAHHLSHHRLLGTEQDPDGPLHRGEDKKTADGLVRHFVLGFFGGYATRVLFARPTYRADPGNHLRDRRNLVIAQLTLFTILCPTLGWWVYPCFWLAPLLTLTTAAHLIRSYVEHALNREEEHQHPGRLVSIRSNPLERFIIAPYFMNYHAEHHLFPWIPSQHLPEVHRRLSAAVGEEGPLLRSGYFSLLADHYRRLPMGSANA